MSHAPFSEVPGLAGGGLTSPGPKVPIPIDFGLARLDYCQVLDVAVASAA